LSRLPPLNYRRVIAALERGGFYLDHSTGGHDRYKHRLKTHLRVTVPKHRGDLARRVLRSILKQAELSEEEFRELL
jgi:predicted RNA binding protein YcfA (HicA-like mRNA interferase family)